MLLDDYFGDWIKVIDKEELLKIMGWLKTLNPNNLCPMLPNIFRAFRLCALKDCKIVMIGQDPYPDKFLGKPRATGILFGNSKEISEDDLSPSLQVVKESAINFEVPHNIINFDQSLESWAKQGVLMLNSALTCEFNKVGSHVNIWRPFISKLIKNISTYELGIIYVLFGNQAKTLKPYIDKRYNDIIEIEHPAYFARVNKIMPYSLFTDINKLLKYKYGTTIKWYQELDI